MATWIALTALGVANALGASDGALHLLDDPDRWAVRDTEAGVFSFEDGTLTARRRSYQSATLVTRDEFENFELNFEFRVKRWCELLLLLHTPWNGADQAGQQLVLSDQPGARPSVYTAGALLDKRPPKVAAIHEDDVWNTCRVHFDWPRLRVELNGQTIHDFDLSQDDQFRHTLRRGQIGFRDLLGWGFEVRNFTLTPLPDTENGIRLYNEKDFTGWKEVRPRDAKWSAEGETLVGRDGNGYLQHEHLTQDFALRLYYRTTPTANGGVFFRWMPDDSDRGNEIQILDVPESKMPSGSIYNLDRADTTSLRPTGQWQFLQIIVRGAHAVTYMNGRQCAETHRLTKIRPGHITLQMHKENSTIEFRDLVLVPQDAAD